MTSPPAPLLDKERGDLGWDPNLERPGEVCYNRKMESENEIKNNNPYKNKVHKILAHSYVVYLFAFLLGVIFNLIWGFKVFAGPAIVPAIILLFLGSILILWAQYTSAHLETMNITKETFCHGPYRFTRTPTNFGLFFMMLGFGLILNTLSIIIFMFISFFVAKFVFLKEQEKILALKYGLPYVEYKKSVKF
jgi:protein-S-isoprenylcysteine O-methyltransferase Ste14